MSDILATTGGRLFTKGLAGDAADASPQVLDTVYNEATTGGLDSAGLLDFGVACKVGTGTNAAGRKNVSPIETTDTAAVVAGSRNPDLVSALGRRLALQAQRFDRPVRSTLCDSVRERDRG